MQKTDQIKWGLIIQGPIITFGQGGNNSNKGFDSTNVINQNIRNFAPLVEKIIFSTWVDSGFKYSNNKIDNFFVVENPLPCNRDPDNRKKQFYSTYAGIRFLQMNSNVTHVLKIRTDQLIPLAIIDWLQNVFTNEIMINEFQIDQKIIFSEFIKSESFYVGDFIFAGEINKVFEFIDINLKFKKNLHPSIGVDYFLKYLSVIDSNNFKKLFIRSIPLIAQVSLKKSEIVTIYWRNQLANKASFIPRFIANDIIWRGRIMKDLNFSHFCYFEEWRDLNINFRNHKFANKKIKILSVLLMEKFVFNKVVYEYKRYFLLRIKLLFPFTFKLYKKLFYILFYF